MPCQAADGRHGLELVDHIAGDEVDIIVAQADAGIADAFPTQLVKFGIIHPLHTLQKKGGDKGLDSRNLSFNTDFYSEK